MKKPILFLLFIFTGWAHAQTEAWEWDTWPTYYWLGEYTEEEIFQKARQHHISSVTVKTYVTKTDTVLDDGKFLQYCMIEKYDNLGRMIAEKEVCARKKICDSTSFTTLVYYTYDSLNSVEVEKTYSDGDTSEVEHYLKNKYVYDAQGRVIKSFINDSYNWSTNRKDSTYFYYRTDGKDSCILSWRSYGNTVALYRYNLTGERIEFKLVDMDNSVLNLRNLYTYEYKDDKKICTTMLDTSKGYIMYLWMPYKTIVVTDKRDNKLSEIKFYRDYHIKYTAVYNKKGFLTSEETWYSNPARAQDEPQLLNRMNYFYNKNQLPVKITESIPREKAERITVVSYTYFDLKK